MTTSAHLTEPSTSRHAKTTLFCPGCSREGSADGDWLADDSSERDRLRCPRCGATVVDQPSL